MNGGELIAKVLERQGVRALFTLCGGHISPILVGCKKLGIDIVDVRDEASAVFAADAVARMTGVPGVAAVTAGPGVTNTLTAIQNAYMAQSPVIILGGATATALKGRGALQDIDQLSLVRPMVKSCVSVKAVRDLIPALEQAFETALEGVPGPVFVETPVDLLYGKELVREWYEEMTGGGKSKDVASMALDLYSKQHLFRLFAGADKARAGARKKPEPPKANRLQVEAVAQLVARAKKPVLVMGSQSVVMSEEADAIADAVRALGIPTFLGGSARGLLGHDGSGVQFRHKRGNALKECDLVLVAGFPFDFRMGYGIGINRKAKIVAINRNPKELVKNRLPTVPIHADSGRFLQQLSYRAKAPSDGRWKGWFETLRQREDARNGEIAEQAKVETDYVNPLYLCQKIEEAMADESVMVVDGGDFVATASYICKPRGPRSWLDPGVFGTLGVGGGFALGAAKCRPDAEVWLFYGDGSSAYSLAEIDTFVRRGMSVIAVIGTDASWAQIARDQKVILGDEVGTKLLRTDYHKVAEGYGGVGLLLDDPAKTESVIAEAKARAAEGKPVVINALIGATDFRKGSLSI